MAFYVLELPGDPRITRAARESGCKSCDGAADRMARLRKRAGWPRPAAGPNWLKGKRGKGREMDYRELFQEVRRRPEMYGVENSFRSFCAFLQGVDQGNGGQLFVGFREFLAVRAGYGTNLTWPGLILILAFPDVSSGQPGLLADPERERVAVDTLFAALDDFLDRRENYHDETARIFREYFQMFDPG